MYTRLIQNTILNYISAVVLFYMSKSDSVLWHAVSFVVLYDLYKLSLDRAVEYMASFYSLEDNFNVDLAFTDVSKFGTVCMLAIYFCLFGI